VGVLIIFFGPRGARGGERFVDSPDRLQRIRNGRHTAAVGNSQAGRAENALVDQIGFLKRQSKEVLNAV
jgi:hypothetical protein